MSSPDQDPSGYEIVRNADLYDLFQLQLRGKDPRQFESTRIIEEMQKIRSASKENWPLKH